MRWLILESGRIIKHQNDMKYVIKKSADGQYYYTVTGANGEVMLTSETMTAKHNCLKAIERLRDEAREADVESED
jgi:uncharacterized protein YegP (UPF0339 family)